MIGPSTDRHRRVFALGAIVLLLTVGVPTVATDGAAQQAQPETDNTLTRIEVDANGSARWTIQIRTRLDTADRVSEYDAFRDRFEANTSRYLDPFRTRMQRVVARAANATDRDMQAVWFTASTSIQEVPRRWGIVTFQFTWTNFAMRTDGRLVVGDIFQGGFFLAANDTLVIAAPAGYTINRVEPAPDEHDDGTATWVGRADFPDQRPQVVFLQPADGGTATRRPTDATVGSPSSPAGGFGPIVWGGAALVMLVVLAVAYGGYRRLTGSSSEQSPSATEGPSDGAKPAVALTDEERVRELVETNGGRIRQSRIVDELGWSASKTSRVVGRMVDEGIIEKLQLGRENLLELVEDEE